MATRTIYIQSKLSSPIPLTNLKLWLEADYGLTLNGSNVSGWADRSPEGNNFTQPVAIRQPAYVGNYVNGNDALYFDGNKWISRSAFVNTLTQPITIYAVHQWTAGNELRYVYCGPVSNADYVLFNVTSITNNIRFQTTATGAMDAATTYPYAMRISRVTANGAASTMHRNGILVGSASLANTNLTGLNLGANKELNTSRLFKGYICSLIIYSGSQSSSEISAVESYLTTKYL